MSSIQQPGFLAAGVGGSPTTTGLIHRQPSGRHCHGQETTSELLTRVSKNYGPFLGGLDNKSPNFVSMLGPLILETPS